MNNNNTVKHLGITDTGWDVSLLCNQSARDIAVEKDGTIYFSNSSGIYTLNEYGKVQCIADAKSGLLSGLFHFDPFGLCLDGKGSLLFCDKKNKKICELDLNTRKVKKTTITVRKPKCICVEQSGKLHLTYHHHIAHLKRTDAVELEPQGIPGFRDGSIEYAEFNFPKGIAFDSDTIYVADSGNRCVRMIKNNVVSTIAGSGKEGNQDGSLMDAQFTNLKAIHICDDGILYVTDNSLRQINLAMKSVTTIWLEEVKCVSSYRGSLYVGTSDGIFKLVPKFEVKAMDSRANTLPSFTPLQELEAVATYRSNSGKFENGELALSLTPGTRLTFVKDELNGWIRVTMDKKAGLVPIFSVAPFNCAPVRESTRVFVESMIASDLPLSKDNDGDLFVSIYTTSGSTTQGKLFSKSVAKTNPHWPDRIKVLCRDRNDILVFEVCQGTKFKHQSLGSCVVAASYLTHGEEVTWNVKLDGKGELMLTLILYNSDKEQSSNQVARTSLPHQKPNKYHPPSPAKPPTPPSNIKMTQEVESLKTEVQQLRAEMQKMRDHSKEDHHTINVLQVEKATLEHQLQITLQELQQLKAKFGDIYS